MHQRLYRALYRIRRVEEEVARAYPTDRIKSPVHLSIGQEAISVAVRAALRPDDVVFGSYRGHALYLAKGGDLGAMIAELYGKASGCSRGKGGSMHLVDPEAGVMGTSAIVGTTIPNAVGYAYALDVRGSDAVVACFFGDGATEEGAFAEALNFAALKRLPILFVCENNRYAIHTHQSRRQANPSIAARAEAHGVAATVVEDGDLFRLRDWARAAAELARIGEGPSFVEAMAYRWHEHVGPGHDYHLGYRDEEEWRPWVERDAVARLAALVEQEAGPTCREAIEADVEVEVAAAFAFAESSPFPEAGELYTDVFEEKEACLPG